MARIRHIALTTKDPEKTAAFYMQAFDMKEVSRSPNGSLHLTDGYIDLAILNWKTEQDADVGPNGPNYSGIHHIGFRSTTWRKPRPSWRPPRDSRSTSVRA